MVKATLCSSRCPLSVRRKSASWTGNADIISREVSNVGGHGNEGPKSAGTSRRARMIVLATA